MLSTSIFSGAALKERPFCDDDDDDGDDDAGDDDDDGNRILRCCVGS